MMRSAWRIFRHMDWAPVSGRKTPRPPSALAARLDSGCVFINGAVKSDPPSLRRSEAAGMAASYRALAFMNLLT